MEGAYDRLHVIWERAHRAGAPTKAARDGRLYRELGKLQPGHTLDAGCGTGEYALFLARCGHRVLAFDPSSLAVERLRRAAGRSRRIETRVCAVEEFSAPWEFDNLISIEVLEHLRDDAAAIRRFHGLLRKGGVLLVSVPAKPFLYGKGDRLSGHYRRYSFGRLSELLHEAGFSRIRIRSYGFPVVFGYQILNRLFLAPRLLERFSREPAEHGAWRPSIHKLYPLLLVADRLDIPRLGVGYVAVCTK